MKKTMKQWFFYLLISVNFLLSSGCGGLETSGGDISPLPNGQGGSTARFTILGNYLYIVDNQNLRVFDISDATNPVLVNKVSVGFDIETIFPFNDKLYIGSKTAVYFFSVADPKNPKQMSQAIEPSIIRRCDPVVGRDNVAWATLNVSGPCGGSQSLLVTYDISNLANPKKMGQSNLTAPGGLGYKNDALYVCDGTEGVKIYSIQNPFFPEYRNQFGRSLDRFLDVIPYKDILICQTSSGISTYDIKSPLNPIYLASIN